MTIEEQIKQEILYRYKSVREFSNAINIPYTTIDSILKRGLLNSGVGSVVKILSFLDLDIESTLNGVLAYKNDCEQKKSPNTTKLGDKEVSKIIEENYSVTTRDAFNMYTKLDTNDQAEIRGEMKHMLRAEKYSDQDDTLQNA